MSTHAGPTSDSCSEAAVALISMPWASTGRPSAALGIIKATLARGGVASDVLYPCLDFAEIVGYGFYDRLAALEVWPFLGEWLFTRAAFGADAVGHGREAVEAWIPHEGIRENLVEFLGDDYAETLSSLREDVVPAYCDRLADTLENRSVLGFSCTFNQIIPSLALARIVKHRDPDVRVLFGGPQCEGVAGKELVRALPWVDAIFEGEFEVGGVDTVRWALGELDEPPREFVSYRTHDGDLRLSEKIALLQQMDESPVPDYDDYYAASQNRHDHAGVPLQIGTMPFESARGCWWGQRRHCTFCGLNGGLMKFRSKTPDRVLDDILHLASRYQQVSLAAVDNIIDHGYLTTLLPRLKEMNLGLELFYETKANLKREDVELYQEAGIGVIQPGIESFSSNILALMRKGASGLRNVYLLKLCRQYGITPVYNILLGFPGETVEDHKHQHDWIQRLHHILPPTEACRFALQRHSPMHNDWEGFGLRDVRPSEGYGHVFPGNLVDLDEVAFYFDFEQDVSEELRRAQKKIVRAVKRWKGRWTKGARAPELVYRNGGDFALVVDGRSTQTPRKYILRDLTKDVLIACDDPISLNQLTDRFGDSDELSSALASLEEFGLALRDGDMFLGLAIPHSKRSQLPFVPSSIPDQNRAHVREQRPAREKRSAQPSAT